MNFDPYAANPMYGSPYQANPGAFGMPQAAMQFSNFYRGGMSQGGMSIASAGGPGAMQRRLQDDFDRRIEQSVTRESVYGAGAGSDPRIKNAISYMEKMGLANEGATQDLRIQNEFQRLKDDDAKDGTKFTVGSQTFEFQKNKHGGQYRELDEEGDYIRNEAEDSELFRRRERRTQDARLNAGHFINSTETGQRMFGQGFGDTRSLQDAAAALTDELMVGSDAPIFDTQGDEARGRGVLTRDMTKALMEGMQHKTSDGKASGRFDTKSFGSAEQAGDIIKAFARGGALDFSDAMKEMVNEAGQTSTTIDPEALKNMILPKVKAMTDTLSTLSDIYQEADPDKLMRIAAEVTGLNPNDPRNASLINTQVSNMSSMAEQFNVKPTEYMQNVVGAAQQLSQAGFNQEQSGQMAQSIVAGSYAEAEGTREFSNVDAGMRSALTPEEVIQRRTDLASGVLNDQSNAFKMFAGAKLLQQDIKRGESSLSEELQEQLNRTLESSSSTEEDYEALTTAIMEETGQDLLDIGSDPKTLMARMGKNADATKFIEGIVRERNETLTNEVMDRYGFDQMEVAVTNEDGDPVYKRIGEEERAEMIEAAKSEDKAKMDEARARAIEASDGAITEDADGNLQFADAETAQEYQETMDAFAEQNTALDEDGNFRDNALGRAKQKEIEESEFVRDEDGNLVPEKTKLFTPEDREVANNMLRNTTENELRKQMAVASGFVLDEDGRIRSNEDGTAMKDAITLAVEAGEMTEQEARDERIMKVAEEINDSSFRADVNDALVLDDQFGDDEEENREIARKQAAEFGITDEQGVEALFNINQVLKDDLEGIDADEQAQLATATSDEDKKRIREEAESKRADVRRNAQRDIQESASLELAKSRVDLFSGEEGEEISEKEKRAKMGAMYNAQGALVSEKGFQSKEDGALQAENAAFEVADRKRREKALNDFFLSDGDASFMEGMAAEGSDADKVINEAIKAGQFTRDDLAQGQDVVQERMTQLQDKFESNAIGAAVGGTESGKRSRTAMLKKLENEDFENVIMSQIESMEDIEDEDQAETVFDSVKAKMKKGEEITDAQEKEVAEIIAKSSVRDSKERGMTSNLEALGSEGFDDAQAKEDAKQLSNLSEAMEALTGALERQQNVEEGKVVTIAEGTVFTANLSPDMKQIIMEAE